MRRSHLFAFAIALSVACAGPSVAQATDPVPAIVEAYQNVEYDTAVGLAQEALTEPERLQPRQLLEIHKVLAFIAFSQGEVEEARRHFQSVLSLDPDLRLDPALVAPPTLAFFEEVQAAYEPGALGGPVTVQYVTVQDVRRGAALRSLAVPGWGQWQKEQRLRGGLFFGTWAGAAVAVAVAHNRYRDAQDRYETAADPARIESIWRDEVNPWYRARNNLALGVAVVWVAAYVDALTVPVGGENLQLDLQPGRAALRVRW